MSNDVSEVIDSVVYSLSRAQELAEIEVSPADTSGCYLSLRRNQLTSEEQKNLSDFLSEA